MKTVTIPKKLYDNIIYKTCAIYQPKASMKDLRLMNRVLDKLEEVGDLEYSEDGSLIGCKMRDLSTEIKFEDAEADYLYQKLEEALPKFQTWALRPLIPVMEQLNSKRDE